ncbi:phage terminase small subunit P27 family [Pediococcus claussenii]|uniref:Phage terminase, small subunit, P27 family n=1 Tax=Pediococcus claussenii (strain ATCC BAA-344 / DSM 14800 / JCM 18046 / KCTC 3811 / LMG 21948 / P06) TaxID=701521 RepID=G8PCA9_PEDCP|nr:phage terminase small subunit P27 family [Pediococcus claussenii]AEV94894.1 phage terminase, small subunit, P27 family [Pediococcus claussenii ATCC BAA-344]
MPHIDVLNDRSDAKEALENYPKLTTKPPKNMTGTASHNCNRIVPLLKKNTSVSELDFRTIEIYCNAVAMYEKSQNLITTRGLVITTKTGVQKANPYLATQNESVDRINKCAKELGLTISSRARIEVARAKKKHKLNDKFEAILE